MENYLLFLVIAIITVISPGPGVVLTLTNTLRFGLTSTVGSILGIATGTFIVAGVSATSLGIVLMTSSVAFSAMKWIGAAYLIYLGIKLWRAPATTIATNTMPSKNHRFLFLEGLLLQLSNPKAIFFFMAVFPQFIDFNQHYLSQFMVLVVTYSLLVVVIHLLYSLIATSARLWFTSKTGGHIVNKVGGSTFMLFGIGLASANR